MSVIHCVYINCVYFDYFFTLLLSEQCAKCHLLLYLKVMFLFTLFEPKYHPVSCCTRQKKNPHYYLRLSIQTSPLFVYTFNFLISAIEFSRITVKETKKREKEAKLFKQLQKQNQQEAAEKAKLEQSQHKTGNVIIVSWLVTNQFSQ